MKHVCPGKRVSGRVTFLAASFNCCPNESESASSGTNIIFSSQVRWLGEEEGKGEGKNERRGYLHIINSKTNSKLPEMHIIVLLATAIA